MSDYCRSENLSPRDVSAKWEKEDGVRIREQQEPAVAGGEERPPPALAKTTAPDEGKERPDPSIFGSILKRGAADDVVAAGFKDAAAPAAAPLSPPRKPVQLPLGQHPILLKKIQQMGDEPMLKMRSKYADTMKLDLDKMDVGQGPSGGSKESVGSEEFFDSRDRKRSRQGSMERMERVVPKFGRKLSFSAASTREALGVVLRPSTAPGGGTTSDEGAGGEKLLAELAEREARRASGVATDEEPPSPGAHEAAPPSTPGGGVTPAATPRKEEDSTPAADEVAQQKGTTPGPAKLVQGGLTQEELDELEKRSASEIFGKVETQPPKWTRDLCKPGMSVGVGGRRIRAVDKHVL